MHEDGDRRSSVFIPTPWGKIEIRGISALMVMILVVLILMCYILWTHLESTNKTESKIADAITSSAIAQREFACLIAQPQETRASSWDSGRCRRIAEIGR